MSNDALNKRPENCNNEELDQLSNFLLAQIDNDDPNRPNRFVIFGISYNVDIVDFDPTAVDEIPFSFVLHSGFKKLIVPAPKEAVVALSRRIQQYLTLL